MVEPAHVALGQAVAVAQAGPAVARSMNSLLKPNLQLGMAAQVGERADAQPLPTSSRMPMAYVSLKPSGRLMPTPRSARAARSGFSPRMFLPARISPEIVPVYSG